MSEANPWKTVSSRVVYSNDWLRVREDEVIRPDGQPGIYGVVTPRSVATGVVALNDDDAITLVGQFRYTLDAYSWELPEGGSAPEETPLAAAQRELLEETGLRAGRWEQLGGPVHLSNCLTDEVGYIYLARELTQTEASPEGTEELQVARVPFAEALRRVEAGEITDSMSVIGILRAARLLGV